MPSHYPDAAARKTGSGRKAPEGAGSGQVAPPALCADASRTRQQPLAVALQ